MYYGGFLFLCVDYSVAFNHSNTSMRIILCVYRSKSTTANILQVCNQEDFTSEVYMCAYKYNVITFVCATFYLFPSHLVPCVKLNHSSHLMV